MTKPFIQLQHITKTYGGGDTEEVTVLQGLDLTIQLGDFIAIMGPSGCGKSTLMNIIGLLDTATTGEYFLQGNSVRALDENAQAIIRRQHIGFVFQGYNLLKRMPAWQQVALPLYYLGVGKQERYDRAVHALELVGLHDKIMSMPNQLSGGQQQRVCIARALVGDAGLLLADEPTGALDSKTGGEIMELFQTLHKKQGKTIMLITHDATIAQYADTRIHMKDGIFLP